MNSYSNDFSKCPVCNSSALKLVYKFRDFGVIKCQNCLNSWRSNMYNKDKILELYCNEEYEQHPYFSYESSQVENLSKKRFKNYSRALVYIESLKEVGQLLDVACGSGAFISIAKSRGWNVHGIELSPTLSQACEHNTGIKVINASFEEAKLPANSYDVITFWDIIEHVIDPVFCINKAKTLLKPGGIIMFCTPDEDSLLATVGWTLYKLTGSYYNYPALALHPTYHTYFFSQKGFSKILSRQDLNVVNSYSQEAFFEHSPLASPLQKKTIALIERVGTIFDKSYEFVIFAKN